MQYRKFGRLDWKVSVLGFGAMRLPVFGKEHGQIDEPEAIRMIRYAIDHGVNYLDSAFLYHAGNSEKVVGKALNDGYRERMKLATKLPARMIESEADFDRIFNQQLEKLQTNMIDFYLLHGLNAQNWHKVRDFNILRWAERQMSARRIGHLGFSFHDEYDAFKEIVDSYDNWALSQVQYNYMDAVKQAGRKGVGYAAGKGLAVVVMEPIRGGMLSKKLPDHVAKLWQSAPRKRSAAEWALLWVWNQPEVSVALSGMSTMEQVVENVDIAGRSRPGLLTPAELALYDKVKETYSNLRPVPCTACKYCQPCPSDVDIPRIFELYNDSMVYDDPNIGNIRYTGPGGIPEANRADKCEECGACVEVCPQQIAVPDELKRRIHG